MIFQHNEAYNYVRPVSCDNNLQIFKTIVSLGCLVEFTLAHV